MTTREPRLGFLLLPLMAVLTFGPSSAHADFDLQAYQAHLAEVMNLDAATFLESNRPFGPYARSVPQWSVAPDYLGDVVSLLQLTAGEQQLLQEHGFVVSERLERESYGSALLEVWHADLPVYLSTDVFLHALHRSFLIVQKDLEQYVLLSKLEEALDRMHDDWVAMADRYADDPRMQDNVADVDVYLAVARSLVAALPRSSRGGNQAQVDDLLARITAETPATIPLFNEYPRIVDFSQFRVRGYYTENLNLQRWFRALMWMGRVDFRLTPPPGEPVTPNVDREIVDAFLMRELAAEPYVRERLDAIDRVVRTFVGPPDNSTLDVLDQLQVELELSDASDLWDEANLSAFKDRLRLGDLQPQAINSRIMLGDPMGGEPLDPPYAFLLMGQRFVVDSYVFWNVVFDRIAYNGQPVFRGLPDPLDALYALGNDDVLPLLSGQLEEYHYAANLSALRYLIDSYDDDFWGSNLYGRWLNAIRALAQTGQQEGAPDYMRTAAFQQEKMNTQLASWAELRHDTLLYAKQSYTGGVTCSYPRAYLEPVPEFYRRLKDFATTAKVGLQNLGLTGWEIDRPIRYYERMEEIIDPLVVIAEKELSGEPLSIEEIELLQGSLFENEGCGSPVEYGWIRELYYDESDAPVRESDRVIADVHTQPTNEFGAPVGKVLHVATGDPTLGVFVAQNGNWPLTAYIGPVASYHEMVTHDFDRFTDERWGDLYDTLDRPARPDWTWLYLADAEGNARTGGRSLSAETPTGEEPGEDPTTPLRPRVVAVRNQPNPFNPSTLIVFRLESAGTERVEVRVVDARGRHVRDLLRDELRGGREHIVPWRGDDARGRSVASGVYHVVITIAGQSAVHHKVSLVR